MKFSKKKHVEEAEKYRDRIGDRIFHPDKVEPDKSHLIPDDIQRVKRILSLFFGKKVLDVGCSDGTITIEIAKMGNCEIVIGVDVSPSAIEEAQEKLRAQDLPLRKKIRFKKEFIEELDFPNDYFDTIFACETLEHIGRGQLEFTIKNLVRMLRKDGNMIISVPNKNPAEKYVKEKRDRWNWPTHYQYFNKTSLNEHLSRYFKEIDFYPLYDNEFVEESIYLICNCRNKVTS